MKPSTSKQASPGRPVKTFKVPEEEEALLEALMAKLELNQTDVILRGIRRLAELEGLRQPPSTRDLVARTMRALRQPAHRPKRST